MAVAGAKRIFEFMDEKPEQDNGKVTLVNVKEENGNLIEVSERTGKWAWKYPHSDGRIEYIKLAGYAIWDRHQRYIDVLFGTGLPAILEYPNQNDPKHYGVLVSWDSL